MDKICDDEGCPNFGTVHICYCPEEGLLTPEQIKAFDMLSEICARADAFNKSLVVMPVPEVRALLAAVRRYQLRAI